MNEYELARRALLLEALRMEVNEASWEARCELEHCLVMKDGVPDEDAWCDKAMVLTEGNVTPEFTKEGFHVMDWQKFEQWATDKGFAHMQWVVDEEAALAELDAANGTAYFEGEEVPGVWPLVPVPRGVSLHPSKAAKRIVKEALGEYLLQTAGDPAESGSAEGPAQ